MAAGESNRALEMVRHLELAQGGVSADELIDAVLLQSGSSLLSPTSLSTALCLNDVKSSQLIDAKALDSSSSDCERHPSAVTLASASIAREQHFAAVFHDVCNILVRAERYDDLKQLANCEATSRLRTMSLVLEWPTASNSLAASKTLFQSLNIEGHITGSSDPAVNFATQSLAYFIKFADWCAARAVSASNGLIETNVRCDVI